MFSRSHRVSPVMGGIDGGGFCQSFGLEEGNRAHLPQETRWSQGDPLLQGPPSPLLASLVVTGRAAARDARAPFRPLASQIVWEAACLLIQVKNGPGYILNATNCF